MKSLRSEWNFATVLNIKIFQIEIVFKSLQKISWNPSERLQFKQQAYVRRRSDETGLHEVEHTLEKVFSRKLYTLRYALILKEPLIQGQATREYSPIHVYVSVLVRQRQKESTQWAK